MVYSIIYIEQRRDRYKSIRSRYQIPRKKTKVKRKYTKYHLNASLLSLIKLYVECLNDSVCGSLYHHIITKKDTKCCIFSCSHLVIFYCSSLNLHLIFNLLKNLRKRRYVQGRSLKNPFEERRSFI